MKGCELPEGVELQSEIDEEDQWHSYATPFEVKSQESSDDVEEFEEEKQEAHMSDDTRRLDELIALLQEEVDSQIP